MWFEYTYLWPLYGLARKAGVPIITRSINYEALHFLEEDGYTLWNYLKFIPKYISEKLVIKGSSIMLSITPKEEKLYRKLGSKEVRNLPLRGLPIYLSHVHEIRNQEPIKVFFMGSTYNVAHNRRAVEYVVKDIAPLAQQKFPGIFKFYILGKKLPKDLEKYLIANVEYVGYQDTRIYLASMDIALIPSLYGAGMQQKIFEPLTMGIPTITSERGIADYPFISDKDVLFADTAEEYVTCLEKCIPVEKRKALSESSSKVAQEVFSQEAIDTIVKNSIEDVIGGLAKKG